MTPPIRAVIADDQMMVRQGFTVLLNAEPDIEVVGQAVNGLDAIDKVAELAPDVVLMDIRMPELGGIEATRRITSPEGSTVKVLVLTTFDLDEYVYEALRAGASGFLLKDASADELAHAVRVVASGDALLSQHHQAADRGVLPDGRGARAPLRERVGDLTERETEVLTLIAGGLSNAEIARQLIVAEQTVKTHVGRILVKLGLRDRTQAAVFAYESGLVRPGGL